MKVSVVQITPASEWPVSLVEAKAHMRVDTSDDDALITRLIKSATLALEALCWSAFCTQTWELRADAFPVGRELTLSKGPLQSVTSVKYDDENGTEQTMSSGDYIVDTASQPGRIGLKAEDEWPSTIEQINSVRVRFVSGYGAAAAVPEDLKSAILLMVSHTYENRESEISGTIVARFDLNMMTLVAPYRMARF